MWSSSMFLPRGAAVATADAQNPDAPFPVRFHSETVPCLGGLSRSARSPASSDLRPRYDFSNRGCCGGTNNVGVTDDGDSLSRSW